MTDEQRAVLQSAKRQIANALDVIDMTTADDDALRLLRALGEDLRELLNQYDDAMVEKQA